MKKIVIPAVVTALLAVLPAPLIAVNTIIHNATYDFINMTTGSDTLGGVTYTTIQYDDFYNDGLPGMPSLPVDYIRFSVPWNATNFTVTASLQNNLISNIDHLVYPCQLPRLMNDTTPKIITLPDSSAYYSNNYYPTQNAWVVNEGFLAGENHIVTVAIMPISYQHRKTGNIITNKLRMSQTVRLTLSYELSDSLPNYPIIRRDTALRKEGFALARNMVVNSSYVEANAPTDITIDSLYRPGLGVRGGGSALDSTNISPEQPINPNPIEIHNYPYVIITTDSLLNSVRRIAALKRQEGYEVKVISLTNVLNHPYACDGDIIKKKDNTYVVAYDDPAGKVRQYLKYCFKYYGTRYVLLAGTGIPYRIRYNRRTNENDITDLYYSDLSANWDSCSIDNMPELYVGRLLSKSDEQIYNYTDKLFRYKLNPGNGDYAYLKKAFFSEGRDFNGNLQMVKNDLNRFYPNQICINDTATNYHRYPKGKNVIDTIRNNRVGFMSIFNHGDTSRVMVYGDIKPDSIKYFIISNSTLNSGNGLNCLDNGMYPMIYYSPSCTTVPYDNLNEMNIGESFTTGKGYGGPVYIGYTRSVYSDGIKRIFEKFAQNLVDGYYQVGEAAVLSIVGSDYWSYNESFPHAYLGDPSLEIWTDEPNLFSGIIVCRGNDSITISGIGADSVIVAFCSNDGTIFQKRSHSSPLELQNVSPNSSIMLFKHNYIPYIVPLSLQNVTLSKSQYVIASEVIAGNSIASGRANGAVTVKNGIDYEIEASGTVTLQDGFNVEKGATFAVYPSSF